MDKDFAKSDVQVTAVVVGSEDSPTRPPRSLKPRHIQLIGIGGTIGTVLFVQIGSGLSKGGPLSLLLAFAIWCVPILCVTAATAEMVCYMPIPSPFIGMAGRVVDESLEVMAGWNFFLYEAVLIPFEIVAVNIILKYWEPATRVSAVVPLLVQMAMYAAINIFAVEYFGETEYWLAMGKVVLAVGLISFTFVSMLGGNPVHDRFGFRNWVHVPFAEYSTSGAKGRFLGFFACLTQAAFTVSGPEYVAMAAGEARRPFTTMPSAFRSVFYRVTTFFVLGALCVGILVRYDDPTLVAAIRDGKSGASASPYVIAMANLGIPKESFLPNLVNALILTAAFSAGNSYTYCASRTLYGLALRGHAPKIFSYCTERGKVPIFCVAVSLMFGCLSFLQLGRSSSSQKVLDWILLLAAGCQMITYTVMCVTYIRFHGALDAQDINLSKLPFMIPRWLRPTRLLLGSIACFLGMLLFNGYECFTPRFDTTTFIFSYVIIPINVIVYFSWKLIKKTKFKSDLSEVDITSGLDLIIKEDADDPSNFEDQNAFSIVNKIKMKFLNMFNSIFKTR